jgi:FKBP-type peptidyl-prolyl cis-trans isomerase FkpA
MRSLNLKVLCRTIYNVAVISLGELSNLKKLHFISAGLVVCALTTAGSSALGWPFKHESNNSSQQVYPIGPDADGLYTTRTGLKFKDITKGEGARPLPGQTVVVHYTGWLTNGQKFDSSVDRGQPFEFAIGGGKVIKGWDEGVKGMHVGGKRHLVIPPQLGYGIKGSGESIPPNAKLIFDVELLGVK